MWLWTWRGSVSKDEVINRQFLTCRNMEPHHPLQGRELSMCREIQCCFDMLIVNHS